MDINEQRRMDSLGAVGVAGAWGEQINAARVEKSPGKRTSVDSKDEQVAARKKARKVKRRCGATEDL